ncbi:MAG: hypothetical protein Q4P66_09565 [Actinomycetaceae bacterium]|nr:hypothetical protein [Actinomycetaceae bacterium]
MSQYNQPSYGGQPNQSGPRPQGYQQPMQNSPEKQPYPVASPQQNYPAQRYPQGGMPPQQYSQQPMYPKPEGFFQQETLGSWIVTLLIAGIPFVGWIWPLVLAFSDIGSEAKKQFARACLIFALVGIVLWIIMALAFGTVFFSVIPTNE